MDPRMLIDRLLMCLVLLAYGFAIGVIFALCAYLASRRNGGAR